MANRVKRNRQRERAKRVTGSSVTGTVVADVARREPDWSAWAGPDGELGQEIRRENTSTLKSYLAKPTLIAEHAGSERYWAQSGYASRQLSELVQNSVDQVTLAQGGRVEVVLSDRYLYCGDSGEPVTPAGVKALLRDFGSSKTGQNLFGRFGLGFKSLLRVSDTIDFLSRPGSFRFDREWSRERLASSGIRFDDANCPAMRLTRPIRPRQSADDDAVLSRLMTGSTNIVRAKLRSGEYERLAKQMEAFQPEFLLLVDHVSELILTDLVTGESPTRFEVSNDGRYHMLNGDGTRWLRFDANHELSESARANRGVSDEEGTVKVTWVVRSDTDRARRTFWDLFPTRTYSDVSGIINAKWELGADRSNLEVHEANDELIEVAAELVASNLRELSSDADPARHLDALPPRRDDIRSDHGRLLRDAIFKRLVDREILPNKHGKLRRASEVKYPPSELESGGWELALKVYEDSRFSNPDTLHRAATTRERWSRVREVVRGEGLDHHGTRISEWLEDLTQGRKGIDAVGASRDSVQVAARLPDNLWTPVNLGRIFFTESEVWRKLDEVFLPNREGDLQGDPATLIHHDLADDEGTRDVLRKLGVPELDKEQLFLKALGTYRSAPFELWQRASSLPTQRVVDLITENLPDYQVKLRANTEDGEWRPLNATMLEGDICRPDESPSVCVNTRVHEHHVDVLRALGISEVPRAVWDLRLEPKFKSYEEDMKSKFRAEYPKGTGTPHVGQLQFEKTTGIGPISVIENLDHEGPARLTEYLLRNKETFSRWTMKHTRGQSPKPPKDFENLTLHLLREYGVIDGGDGARVPLSEASEHPSVLRRLRELPTWSLIKEAFELRDEVEECVAWDAEPAEPLVEVWPGLNEVRDPDKLNYQVVKCAIIAVNGEPDHGREHYREGNIAFVVMGDKNVELERTVACLDLKLTPDELKRVLSRERRVEEEKSRVRALGTDAERLLRIVGRPALERELPLSLREFKAQRGEVLSDLDVANLAISTYRSDTLRRFRHQLGFPNAPSHWRGGQLVVDFVESLGFPTEWAGMPDDRPMGSEHIIGPERIPNLFEYQRKIVDSTIEMIANRNSSDANRRGLICLPTGGGKTRVAVQAIVEEARDRGLTQDVLWIADREELLEQAIDSFKQIWRCIGPENRTLTVSRLFGGRDQPSDVNNTHVVIATINTLSRRLESEAVARSMVGRFGIIVYDEAHHAIAPEWRRVLRHFGLDRRGGLDAPLLLGLTATPYRGRNVEETEELAAFFSHNRLERGAFSPDAADDLEEAVRLLQSPRHQVLAVVDHKTIPGVDLELEEDEMREAAQFNYRRLPARAERRLAHNHIRTEGIIKEYEDLIGSKSEPWPTLIFAISVDHAMTIAAELSDRNVDAAWISSETDKGVRRRLVERYRLGEVKVLVNHGIFREGFDAPGTRCVIIARPVYSPNAYFQMIGRGMRGPRSGGNRDCLIIDVEDNILQFENKLAYTEEEWLWRR